MPDTLVPLARSMPLPAAFVSTGEVAPGATRASGPTVMPVRLLSTVWFGSSRRPPWYVAVPVNTKMWSPAESTSVASGPLSAWVLVSGEVERPSGDADDDALSTHHTTVAPMVTVTVPVASAAPSVTV
jgi:hypothetical protein